MKRLRNAFHNCSAKAIIQSGLIELVAYSGSAAGLGQLLSNMAQLLYAANQLFDAEPLYRRALALDEASFGPDHLRVARDLNNLALLFKATNRLSEVEPLSRRTLEVFLQFTATTRHEHPQLSAAIANHSVLLEEMGRSQLQIRAQLEGIVLSMRRS
jgi:tetratricopeptide (TPR) repeat protein